MSEPFELRAHDAYTLAEDVERLRDDAYGRRWRSDYQEVE